MRSIGVGVLIAYLPLLAQQARIEGTVVDGAGNPVRTAEVRLVPVVGNSRVPGLPDYVTISDNDGKFVFEVDPFPNLALGAQRAGYLQARFGAKTAVAPVVLFGVKPGETLKDLVLIMIQQGVLSGRVVNAAGDPVPGAQVSLLRRAYQQGVRQLASAGSAQTNDLGEFRLAGLTDGRYYLVARDNQNRDNGLVSLPTFYPSATEEGAAPVEVKEGQEKGNLEIRLRTGKGYTVRGKLAGSVTPSRNVIATAVVASPREVADGTLSSYGFLTQNAIVRQDGTFELRGVVPGGYVIRMVTLTEAVEGGVSYRMGASAPVVVSDGDVSGVILTPQPSFTIAGTVSVEGATLAEMFRQVVNVTPNNGTNSTTIDATGMRLVFYPVRGPDSSTTSQLTEMVATVASDGSFKLEDVQPGRYAFQQGTIQQTSIKMVRWGGEDVTSKGLDIQSNGTLEVVYRRGAVLTTGTVKNAKGGPHGGAQVVLWPVEPLPVFTAAGIRTAASNRNGEFNIEVLRPGAYYAVALEDIDFDTVLARGLIEQFMPLAQKVEAKEGSPLMLTLDLVPADVVQKAIDKLP